MNLGMMVLSALVLYSRCCCRVLLFERAAERQVIFLAISIGHFTQFFGNVPWFLLKYNNNNKNGLVVSVVEKLLLRFYGMVPEDIMWPKPDQTMHFIFFGDFLTFALNLYCVFAAQDD